MARELAFAIERAALERPVRRVAFSQAAVTVGESAVAFESCTFRHIRFEAAKAKRGSLAGSRFLECRFQSCYFGPATLDLAGVSFGGCKMRDVTYMLGRLRGADFSGAELTDVALRGADLTGACFVGSRLERVSFERATLVAADFTGCTLVEGEFWGEPPWDGATVDDHVRYSFGIVKQPVKCLERLLSEGGLPEGLHHDMEVLLAWLLEWAEHAPEAMLLHREVAHIISLASFVAVLKLMKGCCVAG